MAEVKKYLSDRLLSEELPVTYRLLSRALNLHVNKAKGALYEFYQYQNALRANSVFATYMISGVKSQESESSIRSSTDDEAPDGASQAVTLSLVAEEKLQEVLAEYEEVDSLHVYSLAPHAQKDLTLLSDVSKLVSEYSAQDDAVKAAEDRKKYGVILNPNARRKERNGAPIAAPSSTRPSASRPTKTQPDSASSLANPAAREATQAQKIKQEPTPAPSQSVPAASAGKKPAASSKRAQGGGIMSSFAKAAARPKPAVKKSEEKKDEDEDTSMGLSDDGEADDSDLPGTSAKKAPAEDAAQVKSRKQREADLRRMMEESDEEVEEKENEEEDEEMGEAEELEPEPEPEPEPAVEEKPSEIVSASGQGRRRGKRQVMKKKRILDDQGYMVTIQEKVWESFSEDEAPPPAPKPAPALSASLAPKAKKAAKPGAGQGSIMSFFTKR